MIEAHALLTRMLVTVRLMAPTLDIPPEITRPVIARACGMSEWEGLLAELDATRQRVASAWMAIAAPQGD
jgi:glutamate-ammonia-ligase adenylyltransferase